MFSTEYFFQPPSLVTLFKISDGHHEEITIGNSKKFSFRELQIATENFSSKNLLGQGGFGNVYKGYLQDGTAVAVKRLKDGSTSGGAKQFQTEIEMISLAVHRNLLKLYGFCMTATEKLLVYPYMSNGSVASRLKGIYDAHNLLIFSLNFHNADFSCDLFFSCLIYSDTSPRLGLKEKYCTRSC